jgi:hypothetical protein
MKLTWKKTASEMILATGGDYTYSIFRQGDSGYWSLGRTHKEEGVMESLWKKFETVDEAKNYADQDHEVQAEQL